MSLIKRIFGGPKDKDAPASEPAEALTSQFHESESTNDLDESRNAPKRELVQVMLRDTMRKHGIPSDWIDCRILSTATRTRRAGLHVQFIVKEAHERLLHYVFAFEESFMREMVRLDPRVADWLLSVSWEFDNALVPQKGAMPDPKAWATAGVSSAPAPMDSKVAPPIEQAAEVPEGAESPTAFAPTHDPLAEMGEEDEIQQDLAALFAIRDQALAHAKEDPPAMPPDFEHTRPGFEDTNPGR